MLNFSISIPHRSVRLVVALASATGCRESRPPDSSAATVDTALPDRYHQAPLDTLTPATYDGWKEYRLVCDRCHGEDAGGTTFGPDLLAALRPTGSVPDRATFVALLLTGRPDRGMPAAATLGLGQEHFDGLYAYLQGRSAGQYLGGRPALRDR